MFGDVPADMTQEEIDEIVAEINRMVEDGSIFENSEPVSDEEIEEILSKMDKKDLQ
jgi:hypothetical protein